MEIIVGILDNEKYKNEEISNYEATMFLFLSVFKDAECTIKIHFVSSLLNETH
jgi:hypothetical protein